MRPTPLPPVPESKAAVARAAFRRGNCCLLLREELGALYEDADLAALFPARGAPCVAAVAAGARDDAAVPGAPQ